MPKTVKFSTDEDIWLARAWVKASQDSIVGTQQKSEAFWGRIFDYWKVIHAQEAPGMEINASRSATSLNSRWRKQISTDCKKMDAVKKRNPVASGENDEKYMARCLVLYREEFGQAFRFAGCMEYLKDVPIFSLGSHTGLKKKKKTNRELIPQELWSDDDEEGDGRGGGAVDEDVVAIETVCVNIQRPMGVKKAKRIRIKKKNTTVLALKEEDTKARKKESVIKRILTLKTVSKG